MMLVFLPKIFLLDIDGCICEHVDNEHPELMGVAQPYLESIKKINEWYDQALHLFLHGEDRGAS